MFFGSVVAQNRGAVEVFAAADLASCQRTGRGVFVFESDGNGRFVIKRLAVPGVEAGEMLHRAGTRLDNEQAGHDGFEGVAAELPAGERVATLTTHDQQHFSVHIAGDQRDENVLEAVAVEVFKTRIEEALGLEFIGPQAIAVGRNHSGTMNGKLNGVMPAVTPSA